MGLASKKPSAELAQAHRSPRFLAGPVLSTPQRSSRVADFAIMLGGVLVALLIAELGYRLMTGLARRPVRWSDRPERFYAAQLQTPQSKGLAAKPPGVFRVLVLGDSFTYGQAMQRDDAFPARLERLLQMNNPPSSVEVINWGIKGYSTTQEFELLKRGYAKIKPDLVILQITLNDPELKPYRVTHRYLDKHGRVVLTSPIFKHWKSLGFVVERIMNSKTQRDYVRYYADLFTNPASWNPFSEALGSFRSFTRESKVPLFAVVFPLFSHPLDRSYPFQLQHQKVHAELERREIPYLDLFRSFENIPHERLHVIPGIDSHPNEIAHRIAADALMERLFESKLLPEKMNKPQQVHAR